MLKKQDTKGLIRNRKQRKNRQYNDQKRTKRQTIMYKTQHRRLNIEQHESH